MRHVYGYLRASTKEQDAERAKEAMKEFAKERGVRVSAWYVENETGTTLDRPKLMELLDTAEEGDLLLVEQVDRLSRLQAEDWQKLRAMIEGKGIAIVALDLPTSWGQLDEKAEGFTGWMLKAMNGMLLDMLAAIARKDYEDRRRRQREGIARAKAAGRYRGRPAQEEKHRQILELRERGLKIEDIVKVTSMSRATVFNVIKKGKKNPQ